MYRFVVYKLICGWFAISHFTHDPSVGVHGIFPECEKSHEDNFVEAMNCLPQILKLMFFSNRTDLKGDSEMKKKIEANFEIFDIS